MAVVALLKELGVSKRISTLIEGESLLNDGTAYVIFLILLEVVADEKYKAELTAKAVVGQFFYLALLGPIIGLIAGKLMSNLLLKIHN